MLNQSRLTILKARDEHLRVGVLHCPAPSHLQQSFPNSRDITPPLPSPPENPGGDTVTLVRGGGQEAALQEGPASPHHPRSVPATGARGGRSVQEGRCGSRQGVGVGSVSAWVDSVSVGVGSNVPCSI